jgi:putative transposase
VGCRRRTRRRTTATRGDHGGCAHPVGQHTTVIIVQARYRYRIEPDQVQRQWLARTFGCVRVVFNDAIRCREEAYQAGEKITPTEIQRRVITRAKTTEARAWLSEVASVALVQSVQDAHRAYRNFSSQ